MTEGGRRTQWSLGIGLVVVGLLALVAVLVPSQQSTRNLTFSGVSRIEFDLGNSSVEIVESDVSEIEVVATSRYRFLRPRTSEVVDGQVLTLTQRCGVRVIGFGCSASYRLTVPPGTSIGGVTSNGPITIEGLSAAVGVRTSNGAIDLDRVSGDVDATTSNGRVSGEALAAGTVVIRTSNGQIELSFDEAPESVEARSSNGRVELLLPDGSPAYAVETRTSNGTVETAIRTDPEADRTIRVVTSNGDIALRYR